MLREELGLEIQYDRWKEAKKLPLFLRVNYQFDRATIESCPCILATPKRMLKSIAVLKKHIVQIQLSAQLPVVLVLEHISEPYRRALIKYKIPFIVKDKMSYLPFIGTYMLAGERLQPVNHFLLATQITFFYCLYISAQGLPQAKLSERLPFSAMTMSRVAKQLVEAKLFHRHKEGLRVILRRTDEANILFERAQSFLRSPVHSVGYADRTELTPDFFLAGESALSEYSWLNPPSCETYAIYRRDCPIELQQELVDEEQQVRVELWRYDPHILGGDDCVDPLSLTLSLRENTDERVEQAIEEMLGDVWEGRYGSRNFEL